jgi:hypothetical protein
MRMTIERSNKGNGTEGAPIAAIASGAKVEYRTGGFATSDPAAVSMTAIEDAAQLGILLQAIRIDLVGQ